MDNLTYDLRCLCQRNKDGSHATQAERLAMLTLVSKQLKSGGFRNMRSSSLKEKHIAYLVKQWQAQELSAGIIKNRMAHLRWWAEKVGKMGVIPKDNIQLGIESRQYVSEVNKAQYLTGKQLEEITDPYVRMSLLLQQEFGLRREESIKFQPAYVDKGSLIPAHKSYIQQRNTYDGQCQKSGLNKMHGLRHAYTQTRYETLTGWKSPKAGGLTRNKLTPEQQIRDEFVRLTISRELGHERIEVVGVYLGS